MIFILCSGFIWTIRPCFTLACSLLLYTFVLQFTLSLLSSFSLPPLFYFSLPLLPLFFSTSFVLLFSTSFVLLFSTSFVLLFSFSFVLLFSTSPCHGILCAVLLANSLLLRFSYAPLI